MAAIMEADVTAACGPKGRHDPERTATRHGHGAGSVSLGGRRVPVARPRMRAVDCSGELAVPAYELFSDTEVLGRMALDRMLAGLSTRRYGIGLEPVGARTEKAATSTSKSAVSRRFVAQTETALAQLLAADLSQLDLVAFMVEVRRAISAFAKPSAASSTSRARNARPARSELARVNASSYVVVATLADEDRPPARLGVTHWSARLLAAELKISSATVARIWRKWNLQPWRVETFKFSTDPELDAKIRDVVGLYLNPPEKAVVLCIDEKSQTQALDRPRRSCSACRSARPTTPSATAPPRCSPRLRSPPAGSSRLACPGTATRSSCGSSSRSPRPTRGSSCTW
jgi:hypothetical protein